jgi:CelD/BcsL family acetyltransferase involved in cellulose biosynthesis
MDVQLETCAVAIREVDSVQGLEELRSEWQVLWRRSSTATPFQSPDWLIPWWRYFGAGRLCVLVLRQDERLVGIAPFFANSEDPRTLRLLGAGNTDYLDVLTSDGAERESVEAIYEYLRKSCWCDKIWLENLRPESLLLTTNTNREFVECVQEQDVCPVLRLPSSVTPHNLNYYQRKLATLGEVTIESAREDNFAELFDAFVKLHQARWRMTDMPGMLHEDEVRLFLHDAAAGLLANGALRLYALRVDRRIVASLYGFHHARRTYYYLGGFDPEFKQYSPGTILVSHAIAEATRERANEFDFLRGREDYKYRWGAVDRIIYCEHLTRIPDL